MNWTGGHLSRRSRGGAGASLNPRQKEHFAKVQNNLRNGTKKRTPIKWSIFGKIQVQQADYERQSSVEPRAYREASLPVPHDGSRSASNQMNDDRSLPRKSHNTRQPTRLIKEEPGTHHDLYSATPPPAEKRKRQGISGTEHYDEEVEFISRKRQRLLDKGDWVGITYQRPLKMKFASPRHAEYVGRRRKITDGHHARYATQQSRLVSPFAARTLYHSPQIDTRVRPRGKTDVRIHIGNRIIPPGISSSTAPSRRTRRYTTPRKIPEQHQVQSSDVMLLDNDEVLRRCSYSIDETPFDDQEAEIYGTGQDQRSPYLHTENERNYGDHKKDGNERSSAGEGNQNDGEYGQYEGDEYDSAQGDHDPSSTEANISPNLSELSLSPVLGTPFSPSLIRHPIPQSSKVSSILRSGSSQIADSTAVQVGKYKPIVPSSQILDNKIWKTWMASLYNEESVHGHPGEEDDIQQKRLISPGISTAPARRIDRLASKIYQKQVIEAETAESDEVDQASIMVNRSIPESSSTGDHVDRQEPARKILKSETAGLSNTGRLEKGLLAQSLNRRSLWIPDLPSDDSDAVAENRMDHSTSPVSGPSMTKTALQARLKTVGRNGRNDEDPDNLWRKFVFGSDEADEIEYIPEPSQSQRFMGQNCIASSIRGHPLAGTSANSPTCTERQSQSTPDDSSSGPHFHTPGSVWKAETSSTDIPWEPPKGVASATRISTRDHNASPNFSEHNPHSFNSDPAGASDDSAFSEWAAALMAGNRNPDSGAWDSWNNPVSPRPNTVVFTTPKGYQGSKAVLQSSPAQGQLLHIGSGLIGGAKEKRERDIYSLVDTDEILDD